MATTSATLPRRPLRRTRPNGQGDLATLQGRVPPEVHQRAADQAQAAGISIAVYLEQMVLHSQTDEHGRPVWLADFLAARSEKDLAQQTLDLSDAPTAVPAESPQAADGDLVNHSDVEVPSHDDTAQEAPVTEG